MKISIHLFNFATGCVEIKRDLEFEDFDKMFSRSYVIDAVVEYDNGVHEPLHNYVQMHKFCEKNRVKKVAPKNKKVKKVAPKDDSNE